MIKTIYTKKKISRREGFFSLFKKWPYRFSTFVTALFLFLTFFSFEQRIVLGSYFLSLGSIISSMGFSVYFLRHYLKSTIRIARRRIRISLEEGGEKNSPQEEIPPAVKQFWFSALWLFLPLSLLVSTLYIILSVPRAVIDSFQTFILVVASGILFGFYFKITENIATKRSVYHKRDQNILSMISVFATFLSSIVILSRNWVTDFNLARSVIMVTILLSLFFVWMVVRVSEEIDRFALQIIAASIVFFSGYSYMLLTERVDLLEVSILLSAGFFLFLDFFERLLLGTLNGTILLVYGLISFVILGVFL